MPRAGGKESPRASERNVAGYTTIDFACAQVEFTVTAMDTVVAASMHA